MKKIFALLFLFVYVQLSFAQKLSGTYGKIGLDDVQYNSCEYDSTADAVVLFDLAESRYVENGDNGFDIIFERTTRIKILRDGGIKWGEIEIPYYNSNNIFEKVYDIDATTYNYEDYQINKTKLDLKNCHDEKRNENWMLKKFVLPNVKKGSIIEFTYKIQSPYVFKLRDWEFQWSIPVLISQYVVKLIPFYQYQFKLQNASDFDLHTSEIDNYEWTFGGVRYKDMIHTFGMNNVRAFNDEEFISSKDDYIIKLDFQLPKITHTDGTSKDILTTWPKLNEDMLEEDNFGKFAEKTKKMTPKILNPAGFASMNPRQKFDSVMNFVKQNYTWDKKTRKYASKKPADLIKDKFGNSADINLFAVGLLNGVGVETYPVLISTRNNGKIKLDYPFIDYFNNTLLVAKIDSSYLLADATDVMLANNRIPSGCINDKGLIVQKQKTEWINLRPRQISKFITNFIFDLKDTIKNSTITLKADEYEGLNMRKNPGTDLKKIQKQLVKNNYQVADSDIVTRNQNLYSKPYYLSFKFNYLPEKINGKIYLAPFLSEVIKNNPLKQNERNYPIDMVYPKYKSYVSAIKLPTDYTIEYLPENLKIDNDQFELEYFTSVSDNILTISFNYCFKQAEYPAKEYQKIKYYFNEVVKKGAEKVVLIKK